MTFQGKKIIYVTREIERALGVVPSRDYLIISNRTTYGESAQKQYPDFITLIEPIDDKVLGTTELLNHPTTRSIISKAQEELSDSGEKIQVSILVFKNTLRVEAATQGNGWNILNPKSSLSEKVENKISQIRWLNELGQKYLPSHVTKIVKSIVWKNDPFIIQWSHGHTGDGTILVKTREQLASIQEKFPERMARLSAFVQGASYTVNSVVTSDKILVGNISYQITGLAPFTENEFSTIGNDWGLASTLLNEQDKQNIQNIAREVGQKLQTDGWRGLFGIDVIKQNSNGRIHLIEVNARQPASTTFESHLQEETRRKGRPGLTSFEAHLRSLLGLPIDQELIEINDGAQIVQRVTKSIQGVFDDVGDTIKKAGYDVIIYQNTEYNSDLIRIQSPVSIMENHGVFNLKGREILSKIKDSQFKIEI